MPPLDAPPTDYGQRLLVELMRLRRAGGLELTETAPLSGVYRFTFYAGGWRVSVDLDRPVLELRAYHHRDEISMLPVPEQTMQVLLGDRPPAETAGPRPDAGEVLDALRKVVAHWREMNPRLFMQPPVKVGHPDNWNNA